MIAAARFSKRFELHCGRLRGMAAAIRAGVPARLRPAAMFAAVLIAAAAAATEPSPDDAPPAAASTPQRAKLPIASGMPQVRLPHARQATLDNGLQLFVLEGVSQVPTFTARLVLTGAGGLHEPAQRRGLASFTANLLREGTSTRSAQEVARQLESLGATLDVDAPLDSANATITISGLATHFDPALDLLADMIRHPVFAQEEAARYASRTIAQLELQRARPEFASQEQLLRALYGNHPAALAAPPAADIKATTTADLRQFHAAHYLPNAALLVVATDETLEQILPKVQRAFGDWRRGKNTAQQLPAVPKPRARGVHLIDRPGSVQTMLQLGTLGITRSDPDYFPLLVMNEVFGGQSSSRLYQNLREKHGYTYGSYSGFSATAIPGVWQISTPVRTPVTADAMKELLAEMQRIRREPVTAAELADAKRALIGKYIFALERPASLVDNVIAQQIYALPAHYWDEYPRNVQRVSVDDVQRVARRVIDLEHLQIAAVGDAAKIRAMLAAYGPLADGPQAQTQPGGDSQAAGSGALAGSQHAASEFSAAERADFAQTIARIADRVLAGAARQREGIGWTETDEQGKPRESFNFYDGSPGITYFLLKAYQALGDERYRQAAEQGLAHVLSAAHEDANGLFFDEKLNGVFVGNAGAGYLFLYAYHVTGEQRYRTVAERIARRIVAVADVGETSYPDIIAGAAGAGLFLLEMHQASGDPLYLQGAIRLGDFLLAHAEPRAAPDAGATWKLTDAGQGYYFVGFSHGPAGIGYYLDRLYRATGEQRYRRAADQAMAHIEAVAIRERAAGQDTVKWYHEQLKRAERYSSQWCHGAPGMNPFFLQLYSRNHERRFLDWAVSNTRYLVARGVDVRKNPGVCHGISGNAASLYLMYRATGDEAYLATIRHAVELIHQYIDERLDQPPANPGGEDYSYMTGLAGVGDFLVLLYSRGELDMFGPLGYGDDLDDSPHIEPAQRLSASER